MAQYPDEEMMPADKTQGALSAAEAREAQGKTLLPDTDLAGKRTMKLQSPIWPICRLRRRLALRSWR